MSEAQIESKHSAAQKPCAGQKGRLLVDEHRQQRLLRPRRQNSCKVITHHDYLPLGRARQCGDAQPTRALVGG